MPFTTIKKLALVLIRKPKTVSKPKTVKAIADSCRGETAEYLEKHPQAFIDLVRYYKGNLAESVFHTKTVFDNRIYMGVEHHDIFLETKERERELYFSELLEKDLTPEELEEEKYIYMYYENFRIVTFPVSDSPNMIHVFEA